MLVCDWLITSHVNQIMRSDWLITHLESRLGCRVVALLDCVGWVPLYLLLPVVCRSGRVGWPVPPLFHVFRVVGSHARVGPHRRVVLPVVHGRAVVPGVGTHGTAVVRLPRVRGGRVVASSWRRVRVGVPVGRGLLLLGWSSLLVGWRLSWTLGRGG